MDFRIALATSVDGSPRKVFDILRSSEGQRSFWTTDCEVNDVTGRFGFLEAPVDLVVDVSVVEDQLVSMTVTSGFPGWVGSTWQWAISAVPDHDDAAIVQFRHYGFEEGDDEDAVGFTAQTWALILERLARFVKSGTPDPFFTNEPT